MAEQTERLSAMDCWRQAVAERGPDGDVRARYVELLREHGHLVEREPGADRRLPCGYDPYER